MYCIIIIRVELKLWQYLLCPRQYLAIKGIVHGLSVHAFNALSRYHILKLCEQHNILETACENFTRFTATVPLVPEMNGVDFEIKRYRS